MGKIVMYGRCLRLALACVLAVGLHATSWGQQQAPAAAGKPSVVLTQEQLVKALRAKFELDRKDLYDSATRETAGRFVDLLGERFATLNAQWLREIRASRADRQTPRLAGASELKMLTTQWVEAMAVAVLNSPDDDKLAIVEAVSRGGDACSRPASPLLADSTAIASQLRGLDAQGRAQWLAEAERSIQRLGRGTPPQAPSPPYEIRFTTALLSAAIYPGSATVPLDPKFVARIAKDSRDFSGLVTDPAEACELLSWWARTVLKKPVAERSEDTLALLFSMVPGISEIALQQVRTSGAALVAPGTPTDYPTTAAYFGIEGRTMVEVHVGTDGLPLQAAVISRDVTVPGMEGRRSTVFETVFDEASISNAMGRTYAPPAKGKRGPQPYKAQYEIVWTLE